MHGVVHGIGTTIATFIPRANYAGNIIYEKYNNILAVELFSRIILSSK